MSPDPSRLLAANVGAVLKRVRAAERRSGRAPGAVALLAVVKNVPDVRVAELLAHGVVDVAENRVQALEGRAPGLRAAARFHLVGHLQTNKARAAVQGFHSCHSVDSPRVALALARQADGRGSPYPVYLQVNLGGEPQKHGCSWEALEALVEAIRSAPGLELRGLMGIAPYAPEPEPSRPLFRRLREASRRLLERGLLPPGASGLSIGMSGDFEVAVEEGATVVRVGSALFDGVFAAGPASG